MTNLIEQLKDGAIVQRKHSKQALYYRVGLECPTDGDEYRIFMAQRMRRDGVCLQAQRVVTYSVGDDRLIGWVLVDDVPWKETA